ncbi:unnamed protein product, partial [Mesorhabditis belari]|uniref:rRNA methyltransferase 1, mitochondrial n=1 Tax=Mesorhabditis belari TaxID=2138241 RepID=A0AAF3EBP3_9BILA
MKRIFARGNNALIVRNYSDSEQFKYRPNLLHHRAKKTGKSVEEIIKNANRVPIPAMKGEPLFGVHSVIAALTAQRRKPHVLYMKESVRARAESNETLNRLLTLAEERKLPIRPLAHDQLDRITQFQLHNGVVLDCGPLTFAPLTDMVEVGFLVFLDRVLDPGNVGALARTIAFFGGSGIAYALDRGPHTITPSMSKASAGALEYLPVVTASTSSEFFEKCHSKGYFVVGTADPGSAIAKNRNVLDISDFKPPPRRPIVVVMGDEGTGISPEVSSRCDAFVSIGSPQIQNVPSLNVSVAAGVLLHHLWLSLKERLE